MVSIQKVRFDHMMTRAGRDATLQRVNPPETVTVRLMSRRAEEESLIHEVSQQKKWFTLSKQSLDDEGFSVPPRKGDRIKDRSNWHTIAVVDEINDGPNVIGYTARCLGGQSAL